MQISNPEVLHQKNEVLYRVNVDSAEGNDTLWYRLPSMCHDLITTSSDAPLVALLLPAMAQGEDIHVAGSISERLWYNLSRPYQRLLQHAIPWLRPVNIYPEELQHTDTSPPGVATGFSAGVDSFSVLADHYYSEVPAAFRVTHLLYNNVGSHGTGGSRLFQERYARLEPVAHRMGLPFVTVDSNVDAFYGKGLGFTRTHTARNASVALLLQRGIGRYMYASAYSYSDVFVGESNSSAYTDTIALPLLSTETLDALSVGSEYTRVEKTLRVAGLPDSYRALDVCANAEHSGEPANCSTCWKCKLTLLTLDIAGVMERYSASFNLEVYKQVRSNFICRALTSHGPHLREVVQFARARGYSFPWWTRLLGVMHDYSLGLTTRIAGLPIRAVRRACRALQK